MEMPPLTEIFGSYRAWKYDEATWIISFMEGSEYLYLLEGSERALLLDAGYGTNTLRPFVEKLTDKPILLANTHYHPDHAGGNGEFESVILHKNWRLDSGSLRPGPNLPFDITALPHPDYRRTEVSDGDTIELGGRTVELMDISAHSNSSLGFLDRGERMFFCGDELEAGQVLMYDLSGGTGPAYDLKSRLLAHRENMRRILALSDEFDHLFPNHNGTPIAKSYIGDFIALTDSIFAGGAEIEDELRHRYIEMDPIAPRLCRVKLGAASFFVEKEPLMEFYGKGA